MEDKNLGKTTKGTQRLFATFHQLVHHPQQAEMDLNLLVEPEKPPAADPPATSSSAPTSSTTQEPKPALRKRFSSISDLVNNDDNPNHSSSPLKPATNSPVLMKTTIPSSAAVTPVTHKLEDIKARNSISSLTNDTDVDVDGKETPSIARRLSYEVSASESNSPVVPKKTITRAPSLQDMINTDEPIEFEEPVYTEEGDAPSAPTPAAKGKKRAKRAPKSVTPKTEVDDSKEDKKNPATKTTPRKQKASTPKAKTHNIEDEINQLETIEKGGNSNGNSNKPKRYTKPPVWAQTWVSTFKPKRGRTAVSRNGTAEHEVSMTGVKPFTDFTRRVTNWVYSQIATVPPEQRKYLELEVKFGRIWHKETDRRILVPVTNECIIDDSYILDCYYRAGMEKEHYDRVKKYVTGLTRLHKEKFKTMKYDHIDRTYREAARDQLPKFYRITTDARTGRMIHNIQKIKLGSLFVHSPDLIFDYRLTMSLELPGIANPERFENHTPESERAKKRTSFFHDATATRIDMTEVTSKVKGRNDSQTESFEVEFEIDMEKLLAAFDNLDTDQFTFEELSETLIDNVRIVNRELAKAVPK